jgi:hypothetical protein
MEVKMASVVRHPHPEHLDVPVRVYWSAGIGLALLALVLSYFSMTSPVRGALCF